MVCVRWCLTLEIEAEDAIGVLVISLLGLPPNKAPKPSIVTMSTCVLVSETQGSSLAFSLMECDLMVRNSTWTIKIISYGRLE